MSTATLEQLMETNGGDVVTIRGEDRWVTTDNRNHSVVGPKRHRRKANSLRKKGSGRVQQDNTENAETRIIHHVGGQATGFSGPFASWNKKPEPEPTTWVQRQRANWRDRFYDTEFHAAVTHAAADVIIWSVAAFSVVAAVKGVIWLVTL